MYTTYHGPNKQHCRSLVELAKLLGMEKMEKVTKGSRKDTKRSRKDSTKGSMMKTSKKLTKKEMKKFSKKELKEYEKERKKIEKEEKKLKKKLIKDAKVLAKKQAKEAKQTQKLLNKAKKIKKASKKKRKLETPPLIGQGLARKLQNEVTDALVHTRSLDNELNLLDYKLMDIFNAVDTCSIAWSDGTEHNCASAFQSVPTSLDAIGYHAVVRHPIGLRNVHTNIQRGNYKDIMSLSKDLRRMIHNAKLYNLPGSMIHADATRLSASLQHIMSKQQAQLSMKQKQNSVRRRQARNASPEQYDRKSPIATSGSSLFSSSSSSSTTTSCELCSRYERPTLPGDNCPIGHWICGDCRANSNVATSSNVIGKSVRVWWPSDEEYYIGRILAFEATSGQHRVYYDVDHDWEFLDLSTQDMVFLE